MKAFYNPKRKKDGVIVDQILSGGDMKPNGKLQDIHEQSTVQNYDIGTRLVVDDRVFRYCKAGTAMRELIGGLCGMSQIECNTHATASKEGTYEVTILDTVARNKDHYAGGYYWGQIYGPETTGIGPMYRIKSSEKSVGTSVKLTLETPLVIEIPAGCWSTTWASIYGNIRTEILPEASLVCMPLIQVEAGSYFWGQTWGPCFMQCGAAADSDYDRELYYRADYFGCIKGSDVDFATGDIIPQRVGFVLPNTAPVGPDNFFMLQLSP